MRPFVHIFFIVSSIVPSPHIYFLGIYNFLSDKGIFQLFGSREVGRRPHRRVSPTCSLQFNVVNFDKEIKTSIETFNCLVTHLNMNDLFFYSKGDGVQKVLSSNIPG